MQTSSPRKVSLSNRFISRTVAWVGGSESATVWNKRFSSARRSSSVGRVGRRNCLKAGRAVGEKTESGRKPLLVVRFARTARRKSVGGELPAKRILGIEFLLRLGIMGELEIMRATCSAPFTRLGLISILHAM